MKLKKFLYGNKYQTHGIYIFFNFFFLPVTNFLHSTLFLFCIECVVESIEKKAKKFLSGKKYIGKVQGTDVSSRVEKVDAGSGDHQEDAKKKKGKTQTQDARRKMQTQSKRVLISLYVLISYQLWLYIWPPLHSYTHTLTVSNSYSPAPSLSYWSFFFQNLHPHHDLPRKDGRSSEYLEQERRYYKSYSSSSLLYHLFFWLVFYSVLFFLFKTSWDFTKCRMKLKKFLMEINIKLMVFFFFFPSCY